MKKNETSKLRTFLSALAKRAIHELINNPDYIETAIDIIDWILNYF